MHVPVPVPASTAEWLNIVYISQVLSERQASALDIIASLNEHDGTDPDDPLHGWPTQCQDCERGVPCTARVLGAHERSTAAMLIGVDMARTGARGARWSMEVVVQAVKKRNLCRTLRSREEFEALKRHGCWPANKTPTDVHAPLPVLSSMSKAEVVALLTKVHAAEAEVPPTEEWDLEAGVERSLQLEPEDIVPYNVLQLVEEQCGYAVAVEKEEVAEPPVA
eukprot:COSAG05_NODE_290_length_12056_cov_14.204232_12_plen_222_part_00